MKLSTKQKLIKAIDIAVQALELKCGGPGSGVPGPCPTGVGAAKPSGVGSSDYGKGTNSDGSPKLDDGGAPKIIAGDHKNYAKNTPGNSLGMMVAKNLALWKKNGLKGADIVVRKSNYVILHNNKASILAKESDPGMASHNLNRYGAFFKNKK